MIKLDSLTVTQLSNNVFYIFLSVNLWVCFVITVCVYVFHTCNTGVIYQDDLFEQGSRRCVQDAVDRPEEGGPGLVVEDDNNTGGRQGRTATKLPLHAPERGEPRQNTKRDRDKKKKKGVCESERHV